MKKINKGVDLGDWVMEVNYPSDSSRFKILSMDSKYYYFEQCPGMGFEKEYFKLCEAPKEESARKNEKE
jgi:hypothetical protein